MHAKKHTGLFVSYFCQKLIKNGIQSSPGRLPGPTGLVILPCVLANLQKKCCFRARVTHIDVTTLERNACFFLRIKGCIERFAGFWTGIREIRNWALRGSTKMTTSFLVHFGPHFGFQNRCKINKKSNQKNVQIFMSLRDAFCIAFEVKMLSKMGPWEVSFFRVSHFVIFEGCI